MITKEEVLMGRDAKWPLSPEQETNLEKLLTALNKFRAVYGQPMYASSGYRPVAINVLIKNAAKHSNHMLCLACDFYDLTGELDSFCMNNLELLEECGLWLEHPQSTPGWCHMQAVPPTSGNRVFKP